MSIKADIRVVAKLLLPPILVPAVRRIRPRKHADQEWEYLPHGWRHEDSLTGWSHPSVAETQLSKWGIFLDKLAEPNPLGVAHEAPTLSNYDVAAHHDAMSFGYVLARAARNKAVVSVLDWGGGTGHAYALARAMLPDVSIEYHCKDLPHLCRAGQTRLPDVHFHDDDTCLERQYDLVIASNSLQYSANWQSVLQRLAQASGEYLFVTRLPVVFDGPSFVVLQRPQVYGYMTEYQCWFLNRQLFLEALYLSQMRLVREFLTGIDVRIPGAPARHAYRGFLSRPAQT